MSDFKTKSRNAAALTLVSQVGKLLIKVVTSALYARFLSPSDFGLIAMVAVVTGFIFVFQNSGLSQASIQRANLTHGQQSNLFWLNAGAGLTLAVLLAVSGPLVAKFYKDDRLVLVSAALAIPIFINGIAMQHSALLRRDLRFGVLTFADLFSTVFSTAIGIFMAMHGFGYWSLVTAAILASATLAIIQVSASRWRPKAYSREEKTWELVKFGSDILVFDFVNFFSRQCDNLLIGWKWGPADLGIYDRAYNLLVLPIRQFNVPIVSVMFPVLSRLQAEPQRFRRYFLTMQQVIAEGTLPIVTALSMHASLLIYVWFGPQWMSVADTFRYLTPAALTGVLANTTGSLLVPLGLTKRYRKAGIISAVSTVSSFALGLPWGINGVALCYSIALPITQFALTPGNLRDTPVSFRDYLLAHRPAVVSCIAGAVVSFGMMWILPQELKPSLKLLLGVAAFGAAYAVALLLGFKRYEFYLNLVRSKGKALAEAPRQVE